ncbi:MAG: chemotaxis protein CheD, partial [Oligoflexia bacterium]|nr:chemotaxis protein CheD [Oligoflexia bacterium]
RTRYADTGISDLITSLQNDYHIAPKDFTAKIVGGAKVLAAITANIGEENESFAKQILSKNEITLIAFRTGGNKGYSLDFDLTTGLVKCKRFGEQEEIF